LALLNLSPYLIVCLWYLAIRPGFSIVVRDNPHHPALVGFHAPEQSDIGVYRWSTPDAAFLVPGYALPGAISFVGMPAPDGTRVTLPFPGSTYAVELPQNDGGALLRRSTILWPDDADIPDTVVVPVEVQSPWALRRCRYRRRSFSARSQSRLWRTRLRCMPRRTRLASW
jgi:hypothetical protein